MRRSAAAFGCPLEVCSPNARCFPCFHGCKFMSKKSKKKAFIFVPSAWVSYSLLFNMIAFSLSSNTQIVFCMRETSASVPSCPGCGVLLSILFTMFAKSVSIDVGSPPSSAVCMQPLPMFLQITNINWGECGKPFLAGVNSLQFTGGTHAMESCW